MTDAALPALRSLDLVSDAAKARVRARYRAEARFKLYGLTAIGLTALFLVVVLSDIVIKGLPAFTQHRLLIDVTVDPAEIDPQRTRDPAVVRAGDFQALTRAALRAQFPEVRDRTGRRQLDGILSSGAPDLLRDRVVEDPALIGQTVKVPLLLSDDTDLYFKDGTRIERRPSRGIATPSGTTGEVTIQSTSNDFAPNLVTIKQALSVRARNERREAERFRDFVREAEVRKTTLERTLALAPSSAQVQADLAAITKDIESYAQRVQELTDQAAALQARFDTPANEEPLDETLPSLLVAINGGMVRVAQLGNAKVTGTVLLPLQSTADAAPGNWQIVSYMTPEANRRVSDREVTWLERLKERALVERVFNWAFFTSGDSREPELAGIRGALIGSALTLLVTLVLCLPIGVAAAIYLEEFAPKNWLTEIIEVNINNLAAVPSIVFGLLGLAMFLNFFALPRSAPLVGGLVLALLVLPTIIIASRAAFKAVPPSIKEAALGVGASHQQAIFHHVLPLAMPGVMTGTIIGMAHALGETAPLLMIGMVAFIVEVPSGITDAATVLPVQIYLWSDLPEIAFQSKTAAAIMVLLVFLFVMNGAAIFLRRRFERRW
ncbi:MAG: phosphate ABC transporter permease PstA [Rhizobiales bacterium]|nr:phosphate ABC transporter permease PstA [Hyphomicrobiales bacterium]